MKKALILGAVALVLSAAPVMAQSTKTSAAAKTTSDHQWVMKVAKGGMAEVELGKLAAEKASNPNAKAFAQKMVDEHSKANDELKSLAQTKNITLPTAIDPKDKAFHDRLAKLSGEAFDREYMRHMVMGHQMVVNEFRSEAKSGHDPDIKAWAAKTLPTIEDHLKLARNTNNEVVATSGSKSGKAKGTTGTQKSSKPPAPKY